MAGIRAGGGDGAGIGTGTGAGVAGVGVTGRGRGTWRTYVCVDDAEAAVERMTSAGGRVVAEVAGVDGGVDDSGVDGVGTAALVADPAGATLGVWQPGTIRGAGSVNVPGSWNFTNLTTPDPAGAAAFYRAAFGWEARPVELAPGAGTATMWCLAGYGDAQDAKEPGFLRRHAESGTPPGFTDAFGWMEGAAAPGTPASWDVTFAVDDADAVVDRVRQKDGSVTVEAFDAGPARIAVVADPHGAAFTVSAYQP